MCHWGRMKTKINSRLDRFSANRQFERRAKVHYQLNDHEISIAQRAKKSRFASAERKLTVSAPTLDLELLEECHAATGFHPVSFSYPKALSSLVEKTYSVSDIVPGYPYSFTDENSYLENYRQSHCALTFRKRGWDCFRHLEILASGAVPIFLGAERIPRYTMALYPKIWLQEVASAFRSSGPFDSSELLLDSMSFLRSHLTSAEVARYILRSSGGEQRKLLFFDPSIEAQPDYLSILTLIGFKQYIGLSLLTSTHVAYLYDDYSHEAAKSLYGRGFGYSRVLASELRTDYEVEASKREVTLVEAVRSQKPDVVILGSIRSEEAREWLRISRVARPLTIAMYGEDRPPGREDLNLLRRADFAFVREIY